MLTRICQYNSGTWTLLLPLTMLVISCIKCNVVDIHRSVWIWFRETWLRTISGNASLYMQYIVMPPLWWRALSSITVFHDPVIWQGAFFFVLLHVCASPWIILTAVVLVSFFLAVFWKWWQACTALLQNSGMGMNDKQYSCFQKWKRG